MERKGWTPLRLAVLAAALICIMFWLGAMVEWWRITDGKKRDGLELIGPVFATTYLVVLVLPALVLGLIGRWLVFAAILGVAIVVLAGDTLWHRLHSW